MRPQPARWGVAAFAAFMAFAMAAPSDALANGWKLSPTDRHIEPGQGAKAPRGLPDGHVATNRRGDIAKAWYEKPTKRYRHGILGDGIEAAVLAVQTRNGSIVRVELPTREVFEDRTPRLVMLDRSGKSRVVTILSDKGRGASLAIYSLVNGKLKKVGQTPFIGRTNRWRNIAGIADYNGDGRTDIAEVVTPHIGGTLRFWTWTGSRLIELAQSYGFSNHAIGYREQRLSATADFNGDGRLDLALPDVSRRQLILIGFDKKSGGKKLSKLATIRLPARISGAVSVVMKKKKPHIRLGLVDGSAWLAAK